MEAVYDSESTNVAPLHMKESSVDVLIIGAGPAGLMAATALSKAGVTVRIIDNRFKRVEVGQADGIQPRTIEVFKSYGLADRLIEEGNHIYLSAFYNPTPEGGIALSGRSSRAKATVHVAQKGRYPFSVTLHQGAIESMLHDSMRENGVEVQRSLQPTMLELSDDDNEISHVDSYPVKVTLRSLKSVVGENDTELVHAKYVLGSDGAHSWVRKELGISMEGEQTNYVWGVVDTVPETDFPDIRNKCAIHSESGSCMIIPREGDVVRLYSQLSDEDAQEVLNTKGRIDRSIWGPERLLEICKKQLYPYQLTFPNEITWWALYIIGQRVASAYSKSERIFIAGDACHTHSPKAGQGMNASMNDSHNLSWKLAYVLRGWADRSLLKTYEFERRKYAQDLIDFDKEWAKLFSGKPHSETNKDGVTHEEMFKAAEKFGGFTSGIGIRYAPSPITDVAYQSLATNLPIGARMAPQIILRASDARPYELQDLLPSDTRFKVLVFAGDIASGTQLAKLEKLAAEATSESGFLSRYGHRSDKGWEEVFEVLTILDGTKETADYTKVPATLRPHWSKVFIDDTDITESQGGEAYESFGISSEGAVVIVRPDGYIGMVAPVDGAKEIGDYFAAFLTPVSSN
ncbi:FAD binding domain-containing protein [Phellopilus nigrolimitatus]|nr:FAD binding domain-containing protein [Phellopilus nigrolimitatus]